MALPEAEAERAEGGARSAWSTLIRLLVRAAGDETRANDLLSTALALSHLTSFPTSAGAVLEFATTSVFPLLVTALGMPIAKAWTDALEAELARPEYDDDHVSSGDDLESGHHSDVRRRDAPDAPTTVPEMRRKLPSISGASDRPLVLVVDYDALNRALVARALVREGIDVRSGETARELIDLLGGGEIVRAAVVGLDLRNAETVLGTLAERFPDLPLVICCAEPADAARAVSAVGLRLIQVYAKGRPPPQEVVDILRLCVEGAPSADVGASEP
jgi:CheY-like chemotaxis protein